MNMYILCISVELFLLYLLYYEQLISMRVHSFITVCRYKFIFLLLYTHMMMMMMILRNPSETLDAKDKTFILFLKSRLREQKFNTP